MRDPFPLPRSEWLTRFITPFSDRFALATLPLHIHEIVFFAVMYQLIQTFVSPWLSNALFPYHYNKLSRRSRINWDVHVVSLFQSVVVCLLALSVMRADDERAAMNKPPPGTGLLDRFWGAGYEERVWGYTGALGLVQAAGCGYFLWDLVISAVHVDMFGVGMLAHAISALTVFSFGFRPFVNYYAPSFILYELSSPFLNVHWFCDKLDLTGSTTQLINGFFLLGSFASCRLVYGSFQSMSVFIDVLKAARAGGMTFDMSPHAGLHNATAAATVASATAADELMRFAGPAGNPHQVPIWLAASYLSANICLNGLNWFWFGKMIATIRKRFPPPFGTLVADGKKKQPEKLEPPLSSETTVERAVYADGHKGVEVDNVEVRRVNKHLDAAVPAVNGAVANGVANGDANGTADGAGSGSSEDESIVP